MLRFLPPLSLSLFLQPRGLCASPPDGLPPFNAGVAVHGGGGGTPRGGDRDSVSDRPPRRRWTPWGNPAHDTQYEGPSA